jgi:membrane protease YdiL (CAAX protease family)
MLSAFLRLVLLILGGFILAQLAAMLILFASAGGVSSDAVSNLSPNTIKAVLLISHIFTFILPCLLFIHLNYQDKKWQILRLSKGFELSTLLLCIGFIAVSYPAVTYSYTVNSWMPLADWMVSQEENTAATLEKILKMDSLGVFFFNVFLIAIIPAIGEEVLFRGLVMDFIEKSSKNVHLAIWGSAIAFSLFHLQFQGFLPRLLLGALLGYSFYFSRSLWVPIILHFLNNAAPIVALYFFGNDLAAINPADSTEIHWAAGLASLLIGITVGFLIYKKTKSNEFT